MFKSDLNICSSDLNEFKSNLNMRGLDLRSFKSDLGRPARRLSLSAFYCPRRRLRWRVGGWENP